MLQQCSELDKDIEVHLMSLKCTCKMQSDTLEASTYLDD